MVLSSNFIHNKKNGQILPVLFLHKKKTANGKSQLFKVNKVCVKYKI